MANETFLDASGSTKYRKSTGAGNSGDPAVTHVNVDSLPASTNTLEVVGDTAHDAAVSGNPVLIAGYGSAASPSDVSADGDTTRIWTTVKGAVHVADAGGSLTVDNAHLTSLGGAISGTEVQVDIVGSLPAGTATIGKLAANSGVDIGDVDVTSCALPTGAATAAKQPALGTAGTASSDVITVQGIASMTALKVDGSAVTQPVSGTVDLGATDNAVLDAIQTATEACQTALEGTLTVTGGGGGVEYTEGDTDATITGSAMMMEGAGNTLYPAQGNTTDGLLVNLGSNNDVTVTGTISGTGTAGSAATGVVTVQGIGSMTPLLVTLSGTNNIGTVTAVTTVSTVTTCSTVTSLSQFAGQAIDLGNGTTGAGTLRVTLSSDSTGVVSVDDNGGALTVDNGGTFAVQVDGSALTALQLIDNIVPAIVGPETAGKPTIDSYTSVAISASANTANQQLVAAPGASKQIWVYGFVGSADTGDGSISLQDEDDTAGSGVMPVVQNGGFAVAPSGNFAMPWLKVATNKALEIDTVTCGFKGVLSYAVVSV